MNKALFPFAALALVLLSVPASAQIRVEMGPYRVNDTETRGRGTTVISGPGGTRRVAGEGQARTLSLPGYERSDSREHYTVEGAQNPGIQVYQTQYYGAPPSGAAPGVVGSAPIITGGPGSVTRESHSETRSLPRLRIGVGR